MPVVETWGKNPPPWSSEALLAGLDRRVRGANLPEDLALLQLLSTLS